LIIGRWAAMPVSVVNFSMMNLYSLSHIELSGASFYCHSPALLPGYGAAGQQGPEGRSSAWQAR
jgi:hypothetical protein